MAARNIIRLRANPTLLDIERANAESEAIRQLPVIVVVPRSSSKLCSSDRIAQFLATVSRRSSRLVVRDYNDSWATESAENRLLHHIDGVAAIAYCRDAARGLIENTKQESAPRSLSDRFFNKLLTTARLEEEEAGPARTYVAIDPDHSVPLELARRDQGYADFRLTIADILKQFRDSPGVRYRTRQDAEEKLYSVVYELFLNTVEHGCEERGGEKIPGLRYVSFRKHIGTSALSLVRQADEFEPLANFLRKRGERGGTKRFLEISIADGGPGIVSHFQARTKDAKYRMMERRRLIDEIVAGSLSSKGERPARPGWGLRTALSELFDLKAFVSLRTEEFWLCRDFGEPHERADDQPFALRDVTLPFPIRRMDGTQFSIFLDFEI